MGADFTITMAPFADALVDPTADGFNYKQLDETAVDDITGRPLISWFNAQFYEYNGWPGSTDGYDQIIAAGWDPARVVMGAEDNALEGGPCWVHLKQLASITAELRRKYPRFGGIDGWAYARAGTTDGLTQPWMWYRAMGEVLDGRRRNGTYAPLPPPPGCNIGGMVSRSGSGAVMVRDAHQAATPAAEASS